jgi:hypothetical protein
MSEIPSMGSFMVDRSPRFPFSSCQGGSFPAKALVVFLVVGAAGGTLQISLRAQDRSAAPEAQNPARPTPSPALPPGVRLLLPRKMLLPGYQPPQNLPVPIQIVTPPSKIISPGSQPTGPSLKIAYALGKLSVTANQVPLSEVLREVSQKTGLEVRGLTEANQVAAIQFSNLPVSEAIQNLLSGDNYVLFGNPNSPEGVRQARVVILSPTAGANVDAGSGGTH